LTARQHCVAIPHEENLMREFRFSYDLYTPRWGRPDRYEVIFRRDEMRVSNGGPGNAVLRPVPNRDPEWSGYANGRGEGCENPFMNMLSNDLIHAPAVAPAALRYAWEEWLAGETTDTRLRDGLQELFAWIDVTSRNSLRGELWQGIF
jgi:hypothetical protein